MYKTDVMKTDALTPIEDFNIVSIEGTPEISIDYYTLAIDGLVESPFSLRYSDLLSYPVETKIIMLCCVEGWSGIGEWTGIPLKDILKKAKIRHDARTVVFYSVDGYSTSLPVEDSLGDNVMLSYKLNGGALPKEHSYPLRIVAEGKYGYKWIKWITHIKVIKGTYEGYWERQGYSNKADIRSSGKTKLFKP
jgi:DMSO/TMAO reductase YedYZ molybdopterin-dependent catalytic subunit